MGYLGFFFLILFLRHGLYCQCRTQTQDFSASASQSSRITGVSTTTPGLIFVLVLGVVFVVVALELTKGFTCDILTSLACQAK